jgi:hypothetical protein
VRYIYYLNNQQREAPDLYENMDVSKEVYDSHRWESVDHIISTCRCEMRILRATDEIQMFHQKDNEKDSWPECTYSEEEWAIMDIIE